MPLTKMEHYLVLTEDIEATRDFYCRALGMRVGPRPALRFPGYWLYVGDTPCIHIAEWETYTAHSQEQGLPASRRAQGTGALDHVAFNAENFEEVLARLTASGITPGQNAAPGAGLRQLFLTDPNGVKIEINIRTAEKVNAEPRESLEALAVRFEASHPALAGALRQLVDALGKAGI